MASRIVETLITVFKVEADHAVKNLKSVDSAVQKTAKSFLAIPGAIAGSLRFFNLLSSVVNKAIFQFTALTGVVVAFAGKALNEFGKVQAMRNSLEDMLGSAEKAKEIFNKLEDISFDSGIADMKELVDHFNQFNSLLDAPEWTTSLLRIFSEEAKRAGKDTNDLTNGLDIVKRALETGVLENRGINRLQTQFPDINKAMISHFGTDDFQTLLGQGKSMIEIFHGIMIEFDQLPKSTDKFRDIWKRFTGELDLAFAKFGEQLATVVLPLISDVATALQNMFRNMDMSSFSKIDDAGRSQFRTALAEIVATFMQLPTTIMGAIMSIQEFGLSVKLGFNFITTFWGFIGIIISAFGKIAVFLVDMLAYLMNPVAWATRKPPTVGFDDERNWLDNQFKSGANDMKAIDQIRFDRDFTHKYGEWNPEKFKSDKDKVLNSFGKEVTKEGVPDMPSIGKSDQLAEITRWTRETAENTNKLEENLLGGGNLAAMKVSPMELHSYRNSSDPLKEAVGKIADYVMSELMQVNISRAR